jgi:hypothetical protein
MSLHRFVFHAQHESSKQKVWQRLQTQSTMARLVGATLLLLPAALALVGFFVIKEILIGSRQQVQVLIANPSRSSVRRKEGQPSGGGNVSDADVTNDEDDSPLFRAHARVWALEERVNELAEQLEERLGNHNINSSRTREDARPEQQREPRPLNDRASATESFSTNGFDADHWVLPMCDELMRQPHSPFRDGAFLASHTTPIRWVPRRDGSRQLELTEICRLKRYTAQEANTCLANKHVSMIGDSITRYQYLSLAYLLEHGQFPPRFARTPSKNAACHHVDEHGYPACSPSNEPNICVESDWNGWDAYYSSLCGSTDGGILNGRMECHSYRVKKAKQQLECHENAMYTNSDSRAVLSFSFETGWGTNQEAPLYGFYYTNCSYAGTCRRTSSDTDRIQNRTIRGDYDWRQTFPEAVGRNGTLRAVLPKPDYALVRS